MLPEPTLMLFAGIVLLAHAVQHAVGFGAMLVSITVGAHLLDLRQIITLSIPLALVQAGAVVWRDRAAVARPLLLRRILPLMSLGLLLGFFAAGQVRGDALRSVFAGLVIVLASRELWVLWRERAGSRSDRPPPRALSIAALFGAGVVHGLYATGGPLLVYAVGREPLDKRGFRATLSAVWLGLNALLIGGFIFEGRYTLDTLRPLVVLFVALPCGMWVGGLVHRRVAERPFRASVHALLIVAAGSLLWRSAAV